MSNRVGGTLNLRIDGVLYRAKGDFTCRPTAEQRTEIMGTDRDSSGLHGSKVEKLPGMIEGVITADENVDMDAIVRLDNVSIVAELANGKTFLLSRAFYSGSSEFTTGESEFNIKFTGEGEYL